MTRGPIYIVGCGKSKGPTATTAPKLYTGDLFKKSMHYAFDSHMANNGDLFIASAKYGMLGLRDVVEPYDLPMSQLNAMDRFEWGVDAVWDMRKRLDLTTVDSLIERPIVILAGAAYVEAIRKGLRFHTKPHQAELITPLKGMGIGQRLKWLKEQNAELEAERLRRNQEAV